MRSLLLKGAMVVALCVGTLGLGATTAFAATTVKANPKSGADAYKVIQAQLDKAHAKAKSGNKYTVKVKKGSYKLSGTLRIYSNTTLDLTGVKLKATNKSKNMIKVGDTPLDKKTGYAYKNISIVGGDLNNAGHGCTVIQIGHVKNMSLKKMKIHNTKNAHLVEVAGADGFTVDGCTLYDQVLTKNASVSTPEAIQIDILVKRHMPTYRSEPLACKNIVVKNCTFKNVPRGVGSHTAILNRPMTNIKFLNNTFTKCTSTAIQTLNYQNCTIEGNTINGAPRGIAVYTVFPKGVFFASTLAKEGNVKTKISSAYRTPAANQNIVIRNNTIKVAGNDVITKTENSGILVYGYHFAKKLTKNAGTDAIPAGNYYASGVTVENNKVDSTGHGIRLVDTRNSVVANNTVSFTKKGSTQGSGYGIQLIENSTNNQLIGNTVTGSMTRDISIARGSTLSRDEGNKTSDGSW